MNEETFVPYTLDAVGIYPYPELVTLFRAFFRNEATKEQIDEVDKHIKATKSSKKFANAYEYYQLNYSATQQQDKEPTE